MKLLDDYFRERFLAYLEIATKTSLVCVVKFMWTPQKNIWQGYGKKFVIQGSEVYVLNIDLPLVKDFEKLSLD